MAIAAKWKNKTQLYSIMKDQLRKKKHNYGGNMALISKTNLKLLSI